MKSRALAALRSISDVPPLLRHEVLGLLRSRAAFWVAFCCFGASGLIPLCFWPSEHTGALGGYANMYLLFTFFEVQLTAAVFLTPVVTAGAIAGERERDTLDALYMAPLSPLSILGAKVIAALVYGAILLSVSAPAVMTLYLLGGLTVEGILQCYLVTFAAVTVASLVGITQSMRSRRTAHAVVKGMLWVFAWVVAPFVAVLVLWLLAPLGSSAAPTFFFSPWFLAYGLSPHVAVSAAVFVGGFASVFLVASVVLSLVHLLYLARAARKPDLQPSPRGKKRVKVRGGVEGQPSRRSTLFTETLIAGGYEGLPVLRNPVFVKEVRTEFLGRRRFRRALFGGSLALFMLLSIAFSFAGARGQVLAVAMAATAIILLVVPAATASSFPREADQGNLDFLRSTRLSLREILAGKLLAGAYSGFGVLAAAVLAILFDEVFGPELWHLRDEGAPRFPLVLGILALTLFFAACMSSLSSVLCRRSLVAIVQAYAGLFGVIVASSFLALATHSLIFLAMNPFGALIAADERSETMLAFFITHGLGSLGFWGLAATHIEDRLGRER